jgi:threonine/homoserine/homoserine lactone efflux protein
MPPHAFVPIVAFVAAAGVFTMTPGLDTAMVLRCCAQGRKAGLSAALGICLGLLVWGCGAAFGLTALLAASRPGFTALKWIGAAYLFFLGVKLIFKPRQALGVIANARARTRNRGSDVRDALRRGFLNNMLNPKVGVFYATFLPQFIPAGASVAEFSLLLALIHVALTFAWLSMLVALTVPIGRFLQRPSVLRWLDSATGGVFIAFGARLALEQAD